MLRFLPFVMIVGLLLSGCAKEEPQFYAVPVEPSATEETVEDANLISDEEFDAIKEIVDGYDCLIFSEKSIPFFGASKEYCHYEARTDIEEYTDAGDALAKDLLEYGTFNYIKEGNANISMDMPASKIKAFESEYSNKINIVQKHPFYVTFISLDNYLPDDMHDDVLREAVLNVYQYYDYELDYRGTQYDDSIVLDRETGKLYIRLDTTEALSDEMIDAIAKNTVALNELYFNQVPFYIYYTIDGEYDEYKMEEELLYVVDEHFYDSVRVHIFYEDKFLDYCHDNNLTCTRYYPEEYDDYVDFLLEDLN